MRALILTNEQLELLRTVLDASDHPDAEDLSAELKDVERGIPQTFDEEQMPDVNDAVAELLESLR